MTVASKVSSKDDVRDEGVDGKAPMRPEGGGIGHDGRKFHGHIMAPKGNSND